MGDALQTTATRRYRLVQLTTNPLIDPGNPLCQLNLVKSRKEDGVGRSGACVP